MVDFCLPHENDLLHDLRVDQDILRQEKIPAFQIGTFLLLIQAHVVFPCDPFEFIKHVGCKQRLCQKTVDTAVDRLFHDLIPIERGQDNYGCFLVIVLPYFLCYCDPVHLGHLPVEQYKVVRLVLGMLYLQHIHSSLPVKTGICFDTRLIQYNPRMLCCDFFVIHHQDPHMIWIDKVCVRSVMMTGVQCDGNRKLCPYAFFRLNRDRAVH